MKGFLAILVVAAAAALPAPAAAQTGLVGEVFVLGPLDEVSASCNIAGTSVITYRDTGLALGPYSGTYDETGTIHLGPQVGPPFNVFPFGPLADVNISFTIASPAGFVVGTKELLPQPAFAFGMCREQPAPQRLVCACGAWSLSYDAFIDSPLGTFRDEGFSDLFLQDVTTPFLPANSFEEVFMSQTLTPLISTPGQTTGGGQILGTSPGVTFGFNAHSDGRGTWGHCDVVDHFAGEHLSCTDVDTYVQSGNEVHAFGDATHDGVATRYHLHAVDNAESGIGTDVFGLQTQSGFAREGVLTQGDVQVH